MKWSQLKKMTDNQEPRRQSNTSQFLNESNAPLSMLTNIKKDMDNTYYKMEDTEISQIQTPLADRGETARSSNVLDPMKDVFESILKETKDIYRGTTFGGV